MGERDDFFAVTIQRQIEAETALHNGDASPRIAMWSRNDPVTVFGAATSASGWQEVEQLFRWLESIFSNCESYELEIVAADVGGDLAYSVGFEHTNTSVNGVPQKYKLRVTHLYRREDNEWKVFHRHADPASPINVPSPPN